VRGLFGVIKKLPTGLYSLCFMLAGNSQSYSKDVYLGTFRSTDSIQKISLARYFLDEDMAPYHILAADWKEHESGVRDLLIVAKRRSRVFSPISLELIAHDLTHVLPVND
jgi:hypothetical protein